jgi:cell division protein FtsQ
MKNKGRLTGFLIFITLILGVFYFSLFSNNEVKEKIEILELNGNNYLTHEQYFRFARLNNPKDYKYLTLHIIKERLEKHPYVESAEARFTGKNTVSIKITEKKIEAILVYNEEQFFITKDLRLLPVINSTKNVDLPVITNPYLVNKPKALDVINEDDIKTAVKIVDAAGIIDNSIFQNLTEINMRSGKDILLSFRDFNFPVIVGRGNEIAKLFCFGKIWDKINQNKETVDAMINYIDLRYDKLIYIGTCQPDSVSKGITG